MLVNTYTPPSLNETNDDILSWTNASHSKEEFVQTSDHDNILSAKYSDSLISCSSKKESGQTSDHSSSSFHTSKSNTKNITLKKNDLSMSSSESVSSLSSCKETSVDLSSVDINSDKPECPSDLCNQTSDSSSVLSAVDQPSIALLVNSKKDSVAQVCSKSLQNSTSSHESLKSATNPSSISPKSSQICLPCNDRSIEKYQKSDLKLHSNDLPELMNPKINDDETLSEATERLFFKEQVWPSCHQLRIHAEYFGAYWGFVVTCAGMTIVCNRSGITQKRKDRPNKGLRKTKKCLKCNCPWLIRFNFFHNGESQTSDKEHDLKPIVITKVISKHDNGCEPGLHQYMWCKTRAGHY